MSQNQAGSNIQATATRASRKGQDVGFTARKLQARLDKNLIDKEIEKLKPKEQMGRRSLRLKNSS